MTNQFIAHIKLAEMRATAEGHDLLIKLMKTPGKVVTTEDLKEESLISSIEEGGGKVWWCGTCDSLCSPNRPCGCKSTIRDPQFSDDVESNNDTEDADKITLMFSEEEFQHILRALKFCRHVKMKSKMNAMEQKWIDSLTKIINEIGE